MDLGLNTSILVGVDLLTEYSHPGHRPTVLECAPFSLLLTTSSAFFTAQRSPLSLLPYVLDQSCSSSNETCQALMSTLATQIRLSNTCGPDLNKRNPLVVEALEGFQNYQMMREVGCQKNEVTGQVSAVAISRVEEEILRPNFEANVDVDASLPVLFRRGVTST